jgi:2-methylaconitate cis-trans-isomerase PrpF
MTKISQYTPITTLANGDLLDVSQDTGAGTYGTKSISYANLLAQLTAAISGNATLFGLYAQTVQSATITNTTTETSIIGSGVGSLTVPADTFLRGDSYHAKIGGIISAQNGDNIEIHIKTGSTVLASTGSISLSPVTALGWELELDFTIASLTATGSICTNGNFAYNRDTGSLEGFVFQDVQPIDTTIANTLDVTVTWGQAKTQDQIYSANFVLFKTY